MNIENQELELRIAELEKENNRLRMLAMPNTALVVKHLSVSKLAGEEVHSTQLYQNIFKAASDGILILLTDGRVIEANDAFCQMLGYSREEMMQMKVTEFDVLKTPGEILEYVASSFIEPTLFNTKLKRKDGTVIWAEVNISAVTTKGQEYIYASARDITKRKVNALDEGDREQLYYEMFEKNNAVKLIIDPADGTIVNSNLAASLYYGYSQSQLRKMKISDLNVSSPDHERLEMIELASNQKKYFSFKHKKANGDLHDVEVYSSPIAIDGRTLLHSIVHDVTSQKRSEALLRELNLTKDKFFSIIAHDLKSPFNAILGFSNLLTEQIKQKNYEGIEEYANIIQNSSMKAMDLLSNLLDWSRSQTGRMQYKPEEFDVVRLTNDVLDLFQDITKQKSITITRDLPDYCSMYGDFSMIGTILRNLISNALKFSHKKGEIKVTILQEPQQLVVSVCDKGTGIEKDRLQKLFRIDETQSKPGTQNEKGTGLGLILCKEFVEKHKGNLWVESVSGKGSTFFFSIPTP